MPPSSGSSRIPLPIASVPSTAWKYCGAANSSPKNAKMPSPAMIVPQVNRAEPNSDRSTSARPGERRSRARSQTANTTSSAAPPSMPASAPAEPQPSCPALTSPKVSTPRPALEVSTPTGSSAGGAFAARLRQQDHDRDDREHDDRQVHQEDPAPPVVGQDPAADDRPERQRDEVGGGPDADRARPLLGGEQHRDAGEHERDDERRAEPEHRLRGDEHAGCGRRSPRAPSRPRTRRAR